MFDTVVDMVMFPDSAYPTYNIKSLYNNSEILNVTYNNKIKNINVVLLKNPKSDKVVLYSHGSGINLMQNKNVLEKIRDDLNINVCSWDYPLNPSVEFVNMGIVAVYNWLTQFYDSEKIIVWGRSLGTGPTTYLAYQLSSLNMKCPLVILTTPYKDISTVVGEMTVDFAKNHVSEKWDIYAMIESIKFPLLVIHGTKDKLILPYHAESVFSKSPALWKRLYWLEGEYHSTFSEINVMKEIISKEKYLQKLF